MPRRTSAGPKFSPMRAQRDASTVEQPRVTANKTVLAALAYPFEADDVEELKKLARERRKATTLSISAAESLSA